MSIGACLVANEPTDLGKAMIKRRAEGASWKEIADEFDLPNPSAARKAFTKHTGITDYKTKGPSIYDVKPGTVAKAQTDKVVKNAADDAAQAIKPNTAANAPSPPQPTPKAGLSTKHESIIEEFQKGNGYTAISQKTGASFAEIDSSVWSHLLDKELNAGKGPKGPWEAYKKKPTSETGFNAIKSQVNELKISGYTAEQIETVSGIPKNVVHAIENNSWNMPPMGSTQAIIPGPPPKPPASYVYSGPVPDVANRGYNYTNSGEMMQWLSDLGNDLAPSEKHAVQSYTGSGYRELNAWLRRGRPSGYERQREMAENIDRAMRPLPRDLRLVRNTHYDEVFKGVDPEELVGTTFSDKGFFSTTINKDGVFSGNLRFEIQAPAGTLGRYVEPLGISYEKELLLGRETSMLITKVETTGTGHSRRVTLFCQVLL